jgi:hypothetical protein
MSAVCNAEVGLAPLLMRSTKTPRTARPRAPPYWRMAVLAAATMPASCQGTALMAATETVVSIMATDTPKTARCRSPFLASQPVTVASRKGTQTAVQAPVAVTSHEA